MRTAVILTVALMAVAELTSSAPNGSGEGMGYPCDSSAPIDKYKQCLLNNFEHLKPTYIWGNLEIMGQKMMSSISVAASVIPFDFGEYLQGECLLQNVVAYGMNETKFAAVRQDPNRIIIPYDLKDVSEYVDKLAFEIQYYVPRITFEGKIVCVGRNFKDVSWDGIKPFSSQFTAVAVDVIGSWMLPGVSVDMPNNLRFIKLIEDVDERSFAAQTKVMEFSFNDSKNIDNDLLELGRVAANEYWPAVWKTFEPYVLKGSVAIIKPFVQHLVNITQYDLLFPSTEEVIYSSMSPYL